MYRITFSLQAQREIRKLPLHIVSIIRQKLDIIAANPFASHPNVKKLQGQPGYRLRVGDWRVIYLIEKDAVVILVIKVGHRSEVYK
jgi:mRNA interferase RelE/StbE